MVFSPLTLTHSHSRNRVAKVDRLPANNSKEALYVLRSAWDTVDICWDAADRFKIISKVLYMVLLVIGALISAVTIIGLNKPEVFGGQPGHAETPGLQYTTVSCALILLCAKRTASLSRSNISKELLGRDLDKLPLNLAPTPR
jgi:hypothetical protein